MRLFVALLPPPESLDEIDAALGPHRDRWPGLRWLPRDNWHVTLAFLGEVPETVLPGLSVRLSRAASRRESMTFSLAGVGAFPSVRRSRVFWCGLAGPKDTLAGLARSLQAGARRAGAEQTDDKPLRPHLSVARSREEVDVRPLAEELASFAGTPWRAAEVHLVRSHLGARVRYETIATWPLAGTVRPGE
ncbi:RNA 2',3'-cyclic phosphodiesterase [Microtetraspora sp. NBRC 13810]|uniref:RNA 2',3'-cyclic phosphodiesterase n=1 Tax=Microtetraspora sp. NBRC 13810 TaxID=3030990 RepID=UPI0024A29743|nr:RNA 2',3'-cyclic phosphodiesterase [Microtetraspora sp. NBRC 13810]GLW11891.1 RNA 2',3'-cyclic phosphodiesterase [Microtetraspora sp. NBRC 13810]